MPVTRILLLMDNRADSNWGSQATTSALVRLLQDRFPAAEIRGAPRSACRPAGSLRRSLATSVAPAMAYRVRPEVGLSGWALHALTSSWIDDFLWADLVVVNGEGTLHPQPQAVRWIASVTALARLHDKPYWVVNCSLLCRGDKTEGLFKAFLAGAEHVAVREPCSYREASAMGVRTTQAADCAFKTEPATRDEAEAVLDRAGIRGPFAVMTGSASVRKWPLGHQRDVVDALRANDLKVLYAHSDRRDVDNLELLDRDLPSIGHASVSFRQLAAVQAMAQVLVGGRFHPIVFAALTGTPFVAVPSNTHKMAGLMEMLDAHELLCDFGSLAKVVPTIHRVLRDRDAWSQRLAMRARDCRALVHLNAECQGSLARK